MNFRHLSILAKYSVFILVLVAFRSNSQNKTLKTDTLKFTDKKNVVNALNIRKIDANGNFIQSVQKIKEGERFINTTKYDFEFDGSSNKCIKSTEQYWKNNLWNNSNRIEYQYDQKNRQVLFIFQTWGTNAWRNFSKTEYQYTQLGDTLISEFQWDNNSWITLSEYEKNKGWNESKKKSFDARSMEQLQFLISNDQLIDYDENVKYESRFDKEHKVLGCKDGLNTRQKHINDLIEAGYEYLDFKGDKYSGNLLFRNCSKNYICTITIWYNDRLSIVLEWFAPSIKKNITYFWTCN